MVRRRMKTRRPSSGNRERVAGVEEIDEHCVQRLHRFGTCLGSHAEYAVVAGSLARTAVADRSAESHDCCCGGCCGSSRCLDE